MAYRDMYQIEVRHNGLHKYRVIKGTDRHIVESTALVQRRKWDAEYARKLEIESRQAEKERLKRELEEGLREAEERTAEAKAALEELSQILSATLKVDDRIDWEEFKEKKSFAQPQPSPKPYLAIPIEPKLEEERYRPQLGLIDKFVRSAAEKKQDAARALFEADRANWVRRVAATEKTNEDIYQTNLREFEEWQKRLNAFETAKATQNEAVDRSRAAYQALDPDAIEEYCELVLSRSIYPDRFPQTFEVQYKPADKTLVVDYQLPAPDTLPRIAGVKYVRSRDEFLSSELTKRQLEELFESVSSQVVIRTLHELFEADTVRALDSISLNGFVKAVNPGTGHVESTVIMAVRVARDVFLGINLRQVEPRACFDSIGGQAGAKLHDLRPISPFDQIKQNADRHVIDLDSSENSALDEWKQLTSALTDDQRVQFLPIGTLAKLMGFADSDKYTISISRALTKSVEARGLAMEPDARYEGTAYKVGDEVALFRPREGATTSAYAGANGLLKLSVMIAAADDHPTEREMDVVRNFVRRNANFTPIEEQRLAVQELILCRNPEIAKRSLSRVAKKLAENQRTMVCEVLVCVAGADGIISSSEWSALDRACKALDLPASALEEILQRLGATFDEPIVQEGVPEEPGELLEEAAAKGVAPSFHLDMSRVAAISSETSEVIGLLSAVMSDDTGVVESPKKASPPLAAPPSQPAAGTTPKLAGLDPKLHPVVDRLLQKQAWPRTEFGAIASEFGLMPLGIIDSVNEWSDEHLGDFLLQGEDPITVNNTILPS